MIGRQRVPSKPQCSHQIKVKDYDATFYCQLKSGHIGEHEIHMDKILLIIAKIFDDANINEFRNSVPKVVIEK